MRPTDRDRPEEPGGKGASQRVVLQPEEAGVGRFRNTDLRSCSRQRDRNASDQWGALRKPKRQQNPARNQPAINFRAHLQTICGVDRTAVIGLNILSALILISEIGVDMSRWRNAKAFCSWLGF